MCSLRCIGDFFLGFITKPSVAIAIFQQKTSHEKLKILVLPMFCTNTSKIQKKKAFISLNQRELRHFARGTKDKSSFNRSRNGQRLSDLWDSFQVNESYQHLPRGAK